MLPHEHKAKISERVRQLRKRRGLSLRQLAHAVGLNHERLRHIEQGKSSVPAEYLLPLANELGVSGVHLLGLRAKAIVERRRSQAAA